MRGGQVRGSAWHAIRWTARAREQDGGCLYTAGRCAHCPAGAFSLCLAVEGVFCGVVGALNQASVVNSAAAAVLLTGHRQAIEG